MKNWLFLWACCLVTASIAVSSVEAYWRSHGHRPSMVDSLEHWAFYRSKVSDNQREHVVLVGSSRIQLGFSTDTFREKFPRHQLTQLAIDSRFPIAVLRDLANDEQFRGIAICSMTALGFLRQNWEDQQDYVEFFHHDYMFHHAWDGIVGSRLKAQLVVLSPKVRIDRVLRAVLTQSPLPEPSYLVTRADRSRLADYSMMNDIESHRRRRVDNHKKWLDNHQRLTAQDWMKDVAKIEELVQRIHRRGGQVVFVRFPTADEHWIVDEATYPKADYWDRMAAYTSARTIHFADIPALSRFELPDTSHLDQKDAPEFTLALLNQLRRHQVVPR
ncbi:MAG: hypothetical protein MI923_11605 [Phycisphaerales bacterium]|nr:hypothetical protein [Phycisphaerales bacterium]